MQAGKEAAKVTPAAATLTADSICNRMVVAVEVCVLSMLGVNEHSIACSTT
jgi:hypothetical protein